MSQILSPDGEVFHDETLELLYRDFRRWNPEEEISRADWLRNSERQAVRLITDRIDDVEWHRFVRDGTHESLMSLYQFPIPAERLSREGMQISALTGQGISDRFVETLNALSQNSDTWARLSSLVEPGTARHIQLLQDGLVNRGLVNILKGNVVEILSQPRKLELLVREFPGSAIFSDIRVRFPDTNQSVLFTDDIIANLGETGSLRAEHVFEIKAGYNGGQRAASQVATWHDKLDQPLQLLIPENAAVTFARETADGTVTRRMAFSQLLTEMRRNNPNMVMPSLEDGYYVFSHGMDTPHNVVDLRSAPRDLIASSGQGAISASQGSRLAEAGFFVSAVEPQGLSHVGLDRVADTTELAHVRRIELDYTTEEVDYLCGALLERRRSGNQFIRLTRNE